MNASMQHARMNARIRMKRSCDFGGKKGKSGCEPPWRELKRSTQGRNGTRNERRREKNGGATRRRINKNKPKTTTHAFGAAAAAALPAAGRVARGRCMLRTQTRARRARRTRRARLGLRSGRQRSRAPGRRPDRQHVHLFCFFLSFTFMIHSGTVK